MTTAEILTYLERFQTSIVGIIGFAGVILTLTASSLSSRREHQRQVETRRTALRRILAAELRNYARALKKISSKKSRPKLSYQSDEYVGYFLTI